jgi:hypothetical protein
MFSARRIEEVEQQRNEATKEMFPKYFKTPDKSMIHRGSGRQTAAFIRKGLSGFLPKAATPALQRSHIILLAVNLVLLCRQKLCFFVPLW